MAHPQRDFAYCISMATRPDRRAFCTRQFKAEGLDVQWFDAITPADKENFPTRGTLGCFLSHIGVLQRAIHERAEFATVFEDDVLLPRGFAANKSRVMSELQGQDFQIIYWGNLMGVPSVPQPGCPSVVRYESQRTLIGLQAYTIRVSTAQPLVDYLLESRRQRPAHVDGLFHMYRQSVGLTALGTTFKSAGQASFVSNIAAGGKAGMLRNALRTLGREWQYLRR